MDNFIESLRLIGSPDLIDSIALGYHSLYESMTEEQGLKLSIPLLTNLFHECNDKYFNGELADIPLTLNNRQSPIGFFRFKFRPYDNELKMAEISISKRFAMSPYCIRNILVHEMLHQWYASHLEDFFPGATDRICSTLRKFHEMCRDFNSLPSYQKTASGRRAVMDVNKQYKNLLDHFRLANEWAHMDHWLDKANELNKVYPELNITPSCDLELNKDDIKDLGRRGAADGTIIFLHNNTGEDGDWSYIKPSKKLLASSKPYMEWQCLRTGNPSYMATVSKEFDAHNPTVRTVRGWYYIRRTPEDLLKSGDILSLTDVKDSSSFTKHQVEVMFNEGKKTRETGQKTELFEKINTMLLFHPEDSIDIINSLIPDTPEPELPEEEEPECDENGQYSLKFESVDDAENNADIDNDIDIGYYMLPNGDVVNTIA